MIQHPNLDPTTRRYMALTLAGDQVFPSLIDAAITDHDDDWLEHEVACCRRLRVVSSRAWSS
jgi:hypothetical protein